jgi:hypothetical protein
MLLERQKYDDALTAIERRRDEAKAAWQTPRDQSWDSAMFPSRWWDWTGEAYGDIDALIAEVKRLRGWLIGIGGYADECACMGATDDLRENLDAVAELAARALDTQDHAPS